MQARFSSSYTVGESWKAVKEHLGTFILMTLAACVLAAIPLFIALAVFESSTAAAVVLFALFYVVQLTLATGFHALGLAVVDGKAWDFTILWSQIKRVLPFLGGALLYLVIMMGGFLLFILPGIYWSIRFRFFASFIIDKGESPVQALKSSWALTDKSFWDLFGFNYVMSSIVWLLILPFGLGLLVMVPMLCIMNAHVYRSLLAHPVKT